MFKIKVKEKKQGRYVGKTLCSSLDHKVTFKFLRSEITNSGIVYYRSSVEDHKKEYNERFYTENEIERNIACGAWLLKN